MFLFMYIFSFIFYFKEPVVVEEGSSTDQDMDARNEGREFVQPRTPKRTKGRQQGDSSALLADAVNILKTTAGSLNSSPEENEIKTFCAFLSSKMLSYSKPTKVSVQHAVYEVLMKADKGFFETPTYNYAQTQPFHSTAFDNCLPRMYMQQPSLRATTPSISLASQELPLGPHLFTSSPVGPPLPLVTSQQQVTTLPSTSFQDEQSSSHQSISPQQPIHSPLSHCSQSSDDLNGYV